MTPGAFVTARLRAQDWRPVLEDGAKRRSLEAGLTAILSPRVLAHLPPPLRPDGKAGDISAWVVTRAAESEVLLVSEIGTGALIGLLILAPDADQTPRPTIHIGYLLDESAWGRGCATELVLGLVASLSGGGPVCLAGGVARGNAASAQVLRKAGFRRDPDLSTRDVDMFVRNVD